MAGIFKDLCQQRSFSGRQLILMPIFYSQDFNKEYVTSPKISYSIDVKIDELVATMISINCYHSSSRHNGIMDSVTPPAQHRINDTCLQDVCISCLIYILNFSIKYFHKYT